MAFQQIDPNNPPQRVSSRLTEDTAQEIAAYAIAEKRTFSSMARILLDEALKARALNNPRPS